MTWKPYANFIEREHRRLFQQAWCPKHGPESKWPVKILAGDGTVKEIRCGGCP